MRRLLRSILTRPIRCVRHDWDLTGRTWPICCIRCGRPSR